jgi:glycosyltransferase involved in cell wall biosynthesis
LKLDSKLSNSRSISIVLPDLCIGGAERLHVYLANDWVEKGFTVELVLMQKKGELLPLLAPEVRITSLGVDCIRRVIRPLAVHLRRSRSDVIIAAMWPLTSAAVFSWILSGKCGRLYLSDHNQLSISCSEELKVHSLFLKALMRFTYPFATGIIAVSRGVKEDLCRLGRFRDNQVEVIYNPAATGVSSQSEAQIVREQLWGRSFKHHILSVGELIKQKDFETLIRAFLLIPDVLDAKLIILGDGPLKGELMSLIDQLGLHDRVVLPGFVTDPYPWFRSADLFVLSSRWEGFGNVIVEALECGVPVVSTNCLSGPAEILENGRYGKLVPVQDVEALADAIVNSLAGPHDREPLIRRAQDFSVRKISDQYLAYCFPEND